MLETKERRPGQRSDIGGMLLHGAAGLGLLAAADGALVGFPYVVMEALRRSSSDSVAFAIALLIFSAWMPILLLAAPIIAAFLARAFFRRRRPALRWSIPLANGVLTLVTCGYLWQSTGLLLAAFFAGGFGTALAAMILADRSRGADGDSAGG
jgi:hypothetical protein